MLKNVEFPEVVRISHYEKLWNHLDKRELRDFRSTKTFKLLCSRGGFPKKYKVVRWVPWTFSIKH